jgi:hypothetical protein
MSEEEEFPYIATDEDKAAVAKIEACWKEVSDSMLWTLKDKFNDKYNASDCANDYEVKRLVLSHVKRWIWESINDLGGSDLVVETFCDDAIGIASRGIGGEKFNDYFDMKKFLDWKPEGGWKRRERPRAKK